ncbi:MAG: anaerobic dehydrogenase, typically selenocysteine-containing, partial [Chloroflexi bacterium]|nr:anaerobic dehydrogenase, typically selenocysteine-containing [Chloroflexota bacterium]
MVDFYAGEQVFTNLTTGGPVNAYVKDGKIVRLEPLEFSGSDAAGNWTIQARGRLFTPPTIARLSPYTLAERS